MPRCKHPWVRVVTDCCGEPPKAYVRCASCGEVIDGSRALAIAHENYLEVMAWISNLDSAFESEAKIE